ncbi:MAG TPA: nucleotide pyrophosphatase/phosphodiesterase family protein [Candidatus Nanopelagicales bacterium]
MVALDGAAGESGAGVAAGRPLADLLPAVCHVLGLPGLPPGCAWLEAPLAGVRHAVVLLVDGLGAEQLAERRSHAPTLAGLTELGPLDAPFPSTTCVSLTSLGTGLPPGMHGIVGTAFRLDDGTVLAPLSWKDDPNPIATQPEPTLLERAAAAGIRVVSAAPLAHRSSGLTRAALRGGEYPGAETAADRIRVTAEALAAAAAAGRCSLTYVYWPDLDKAGHVHGVASAQYRQALAAVDRLVAGIVDVLPPDAALLVTADHGLVDVPDDRRVDLEADPALRVGVEAILGEPRVRHVYAEPGQAEAVLARWRRLLAGRAEVRSRAEVAALLGPVDEWHADRIGDVVAIAGEDWALVSERVDRMVSSLRGQHGGREPAEVRVPLLLGR